MKNRLLLAEDNDRFRVVLVFELARAGYDVTQTSDGEKALRKALYNLNRGLSYDLLVTDIQMPYMSGLDLIDCLKEQELDIPIIVMTGDLDDDLIRELEKRNVSACLEKPFYFKMLKATIENVLDK